MLVLKYDEKKEQDIKKVCFIDLFVIVRRCVSILLRNYMQEAYFPLIEREK